MERDDLVEDGVHGGRAWGEEGSGVGGGQTSGEGSELANAVEGGAHLLGRL